MSQASAPRLPQLFLYGGLAFPLAFAGIPLYLHAPDFYATQYGVSFAAIGAVLFLARLFDAVQDPFIGALCDARRSASIPLFIISALLFGLSFFALFHPPEIYTAPWLLACLFITTTSFSVLTILLTSLGGVWSDDKHGRAKIAVWREGFTVFGILIASVLPAVLQKSMPAQEAFHFISMGLMAALVLASIAFAVWYKKNQLARVWQQTAPSPLKITHFFNMPRAFHGFYAAYGISLLSSTIPAVLVLFYIRDFLGAEADTGLFLGLYFLSGILGMPAWFYLAKRTSKTSAWLCAMGLAVVAFSGAAFLQEGDTFWYALICLGAGLSFGAELALPPALLADVVARENDSPRTASRFALLAFLGKAALALASLLTLPALEAWGFKPAQSNAAPALAALSFCYAVLPCFIKTIAIYVLWRWYKTNGEENEKHIQKTHQPAASGVSHAA